MKKVYITRQIPEIGIQKLIGKGYEVDISKKDRPLTKKEIIKALSKKEYDAVLTLLTDTIDAEVMASAPTVKIFANYAIGYNNLDIVEAKKRGIYITNTPSGGAERVAEHAWALILALTCRIVEGDSYMRKGKYSGWDPMLLHGDRIEGKTLGIIGTGRIGANVARKGKFGFGMNVIYYDIKRNEELEKQDAAIFCNTVEEVLQKADIVSLHVPLLESTHHLINADRLKLMKPSAFLINTSRGQVVDEGALVYALENKIIKGAGLDVFEFEPKIAKGLTKLADVVITPHIASGTEEARQEMALVATQNIIDCLDGGVPKNNVV
jgi:lactate dehydrogenase-like 2-hydroxyacid dehydrogenase